MTSRENGWFFVEEKMKYFLLSAIAISYVILVHYDLLRALHVVQCESFGCIGLGILHLLIAAAVPVFAGTIAGLTARTNKLNAAMGSFVAAACFMTLALLATYALNQYRIAMSIKADAQACKQYPQLHCSEQKQP